MDGLTQEQRTAVGILLRELEALTGDRRAGEAWLEDQGGAISAAGYTAALQSLRFRVAKTRREIGEGSYR